jgi:3-oxoacyl-[acyl-carrier protein] reductase
MKTALVTGASRGIGRAISHQLASDGFRVVGVSRHYDELNQVLTTIEPSQSEHIAFEADLENDTSLDQFLEYMTLNNIHPDVVVNNLGGSLATPATAPAIDWQRVWWLNVGIGHEINRTFIPGMIERGWGRLIHISTLSTRSFGGSPPYVSAKCALDGYIRTMARDVLFHHSDRIVVCGVSPGAVRVDGRYLANLDRDNPDELKDLLTREIKTNRLGETSEISGVVSFLASEQSSYMHGSIVEVSGGA